MIVVGVAFVLSTAQLVVSILKYLQGSVADAQYCMTGGVYYLLLAILARDVFRRG